MTPNCFQRQSEHGIGASGEAGGGGKKFVAGTGGRRSIAAFDGRQFNPNPMLNRMLTRGIAFRRVVLATALLGALTVALPLRAADAEKESPAATEKGAKDGKEPKESKKGLELVVDQPLARAKQAASNALVTLGCKLKKDEAKYLEGKRSNKIGVAVGSGGETLKVWLTEVSPTQTRIKVSTSKSMVGYVGQRNWDDEMIAEIKKDLGL